MPRDNEQLPVWLLRVYLRVALHYRKTTPAKALGPRYALLAGTGCAGPSHHARGSSGLKGPLIFGPDVSLNGLGASSSPPTSVPCVFGAQAPGLWGCSSFMSYAVIDEREY